MFTFVALLSAGLLCAAAACDCYPPQPDDPICGRDDQYVLVGVGVSNEPIPCVYADVPEDERDDSFFGLQDGVTLAKFRVTTVLSQPEGGTLEADDVVDIRSGVASNLCGYQVQPDVEYVLFTSARGLEDCELEENRPEDPVLGVEALTLRILPSLGTGSCSGNIFEPTDEQLAQLEADCSEAPDTDSPTDLDCGLPGLPPCASGNCGDLTLHLEVCIDVPSGDGVCGALGEEACADTTSGCLAELQDIDGECLLCGDLGESPCPDGGCGLNYQDIDGTCLLELNDADVPDDLDCGLPGFAPCASGNCGDLTLHLEVCIDVPTGDGVCGALGEEACADTTSGCLAELEEIDGACQLCGDLGEPPCPDGGCGFNYQDIAGTCLLELNDADVPDDIIEVEEEPECGADAQAPCADTGCQGDLIEVEGICEACGKRGEPVCPGTGCTAPYVPLHKRGDVRLCGIAEDK